MMKKNHIIYALIVLLILSTIIGVFFGRKYVNEHFTTSNKHTIEYYYSEDCVICTQLRPVIDELIDWISTIFNLDFVEYKQEDSENSNKFDENNITEVPAILIAPDSIPFTGEKTFDNLKNFILDTTGITDPNKRSINPVDDPSDPADPPVDPADPPVDPADPPVDPADPPVDPPADPADPPADPADPPTDDPSVDLSSICMNYSTLNQQCSSDEYNTAQCSSIMTQYSSLKSEIDVLKSDLTNKETMLAGLKNNYEICQNCTNTYPLVTAACGSYF
jgi:hypothetical protein